MKILIVDDDCVIQTKLQILLSEYGDCDTAENGDQALKMFREAYASDLPYDLISMDINMPGMNGHEVVVKIREYEDTNKDNSHRTKILMSTAMQSCTDIMSSFREGCEAYILKPVTPENLAEPLGKMEIAIPSPSEDLV